MANGRWMGLVGMGLVTLALAGACGSKAHDKEPLEVKVLVASQRVEVFTRKPGDCVGDGEFRQDPGCRTGEWEVSPVSDCVVLGCEHSFRLEVEGNPVALREATGRSVTFELEQPLEPRTSLVISGCGDLIRLDLPEPKADTQIDIFATSAAIDLDVDAASAGTFAITSSLSLAQGYYAVCEAPGTTSSLPVSQDYGFYAVGVFAYDEPEIVNGTHVHAKLYPSVYTESSVSTYTDLDPLWQAAVALAKTSSLYEPCSGYCDAMVNACGGGGDPTLCATGCVGAGEAFPACTDEYAKRLGCWERAAQCDPNATGDQSSTCDAEDANWENCASD